MRKPINDMIVTKTIERIDKAFPDKEMLTKKDVMRFCGIGHKRCSEEFNFKNGTITKSNLALQLSS